MAGETGPFSPSSSMSTGNPSMSHSYSKLSRKNSEIVYVLPSPGSSDSQPLGDLHTCTSCQLSFTSLQAFLRHKESRHAGHQASGSQGRGETAGRRMKGERSGRQGDRESLGSQTSGSEVRVQVTGSRNVSGTKLKVETSENRTKGKPLAPEQGTEQIANPPDKGTAVVCFTGEEVMLGACDTDSDDEPMVASGSTTKPTRVLYKCGDCLDLFPDVVTLQQHMTTVHEMTILREDTGASSGPPLQQVTTLPPETSDQGTDCKQVFNVEMFNVEEADQLKVDVQGDSDSATLKRTSGKVVAPHRSISLSQEKKAKCHLCGKLLKDVGSLKAHLVTHSSHRGFLCTWEGCTFSFKTKGSLKRHMRRHTDERPFKCDMCLRTFRESGALTRHLKSRTPCTVKTDADLPKYKKSVALTSNPPPSLPSKQVPATRLVHEMPAAPVKTVAIHEKGEKNCPPVELVMDIAKKPVMLKVVTVINSHTGKRVQLAVPTTTRIIQTTNRAPQTQQGLTSDVSGTQDTTSEVETHVIPKETALSPVSQHSQPILEQTEDLESAPDLQESCDSEFSSDLSLVKQESQYTTDLHKGLDMDPAPMDVQIAVTEVSGCLGGESRAPKGDLCEDRALKEESFLPEALKGDSSLDGALKGDSTLHGARKGDSPLKEKPSLDGAMKGDSCRDRVLKEESCLTGALKGDSSLDGSLKGDSPLHGALKGDSCLTGSLKVESSLVEVLKGDSCLDGPGEDQLEAASEDGDNLSQELALSMEEVTCDEGMAEIGEMKVDAQQGVPLTNRRKCQACRASLRDEQALKEHLKTHLIAAGYKCPSDTCKYIAPRKHSLALHLEVVHGHKSIELAEEDKDSEPEDVDPVTANLALRQLLELQGNLDSQVLLQANNEPVKVLHGCPVCQRQFTLNYLKVHIRTHTGEMPYRCLTCGKQFRTKDTLTKHLSTHSDLRKYECGECGKMFKRISHAREHLKVHSQDRRYCCSVCNKGFKSANGCKVHMRTHNNVLPWVCSFCRKSFREKGGLERHLRTHTGEKPYKCRLCGRGFAEHGTLARHYKAKVPCSTGSRRMAAVGVLETQCEDMETSTDLVTLVPVDQSQQHDDLAESVIQIKDLSSIQENGPLSGSQEQSSVQDTGSQELSSIQDTPHFVTFLNGNGQSHVIKATAIQESVLEEFSTVVADTQEYIVGERVNNCDTQEYIVGRNDSYDTQECIVGSNMKNEDT